MGCTTILVGRDASYNGATLMARNDDSGAGHFMPKKWTVVSPDHQPKTYQAVLTHAKIPLPEKPLRYTAMPNAVGGEGIWAAAGVNEENVAMTATETITTNPRVLAADPYVKETGIGEEDLVVVTLPYIHSAKEGVMRLGELLEKYGTYESNGIGFQDRDEIWWMETIGGHHWMARRVPDRACVVMPNQLGIDRLDFQDAFGKQEEFLCSADLPEFLETYHLRGEMDPSAEPSVINPRTAFGSRDDADHVYNTPRAWYMLRYLNPRDTVWDGPTAAYTPESDDLPWSLEPSRKITSEDVKYILSSHYQGTRYDPYAGYGDHRENGKYRSIGINRTDFMALTEIRRDVAPELAAVEWIAYASNAFNAMAPFYANVSRVPDYLGCTGGRVSTDSFYWTSRLIAALTDAAVRSSGKALFAVEEYAAQTAAEGRREILETDGTFSSGGTCTPEQIREQLARANDRIADRLKERAEKTLKEVLDEASNHMKNQYARSDV